MSNEPLVSAMVINWNGRRFLETCLPSILQSSYKNLEVIVLDCASKDDSVNFVKENYPTVKVIGFEQDPGPDYAYNFGAQKAKGDYILLLNNDVILPQGTISDLVRALAENEDSVVVPTELDWEGNYVSSGAAYYWLTPVYLLTKPFMPFYKSEKPGPFFVGVVCTLFSKSTLLDTPANEHIQFYEELEWCWRFHLKGVRLRVLEDVYVLHKGGGTIRFSTKAAYFSGRAMIASHFICLKPFTFPLFLPLLVTYYVLKAGLYVIRGRFDCFLAFFKGFGNFLSNMRPFMQDRKLAQTQRRIGDREIIKKMLLSCHHLYMNPRNKFSLFTHVRNAY